MKTSVVSAIALILVWAQLAPGANAMDLFVSPAGRDANPGTRERPFATFAKAQSAARAAAAKAGGEAVTVHFAAGVYRLAEPVVLTPLDSGAAAAPVSYVADGGWDCVLTGLTVLDLKWERGANGVFTARVPAGVDFDQLFANGRKLIRARFPNSEPQNGFWDNGFYVDNPGLASKKDLLEHLAGMKDPVGAYVHGYHGMGWGSLHFRVKSKAPDGKYELQCDKDPNLEGGFQNAGRGVAPHAPMGEKGFLENALEELDAPGEWFLDVARGALHLVPPRDVDPNTATFEYAALENLITVKGTEQAPVRFVTLRGFRLTGTRYTFMKTFEVPSGGDWRVHRDGAVYVSGAEDCKITECFFDTLGSNCVYLFGYNRRVDVTDSKFTLSGASCVMVEGEPSSLRSWWAHWWGWPEGVRGETPVVDGKPYTGHSIALLPEEMLDGKHPLVDLTTGPANNAYPAQCAIENNLMHDIGAVEKQISGVFISKASEITVRHNTMYNCPRAAINVNDGAWGGHLLEYNDCFNTSMDSREHGCFNSWGRDRYWKKNGETEMQAAEKIKRFALLDAFKPVVIRNNRFQCAHGYDIDLDDGSSNYEIYSNLCPQGGIKNREGYYRRVYNNITTTFSPHTGAINNADVCERNIIIGPNPFTPKGSSSQCPPETLDYNLIAGPGVKKFVWPKHPDKDAHSVLADAKFVDLAHGDFRLKSDSPAFALGFKEFPLDKFGVQNPRLKAQAATWDGFANYDPAAFGKSTAKETKAATPAAKADGAKSEGTKADAAPLYTYSGLTLRTLVNFGNESPKARDMELAHNDGVLIKAVAKDSAAGRAGIKADTVILEVNGKKIKNLAEMMAIVKREAKSGELTLKTLHFDDGEKSCVMKVTRTTFYRVKE